MLLGKCKLMRTLLENVSCCLERRRWWRDLCFYPSLPSSFLPLHWINCRTNTGRKCIKKTQLELPTAFKWGRWSGVDGRLIDLWGSAGPERVLMSRVRQHFLLGQAWIWNICSAGLTSGSLHNMTFLPVALYSGFLSCCSQLICWKLPGGSWC